MKMPSARLWTVATPIGNPGDLSPRAREVLGSADLILAEDTRRAGIMLAKAGISPKRLLSFFEHNEAERQQEAVAALEAGSNVALISDAGTPLLADPGFRLVRACRALGIPVSPVPGPSAPAAALSAAGIPPIPYSFLGFLPRNATDRIALFRAFSSVPGSIVFFERKNRLAESLALALDCLGERELAICRELTKEHEEFIIGSLSEGQLLADGLLGEITVIIGPKDKAEKTAAKEARVLLGDALGSGLKPREAAKAVKPMLKGWSSSALYDLALEIAGSKTE